jgi:hypothetical protein
MRGCRCVHVVSGKQGHWHAKLSSIIFVNLLLCQVVVRNLQGKGTPLASCLQLPALLDHLCLQVSNPAGRFRLRG